MKYKLYILKLLLLVIIFSSCNNTKNKEINTQQAMYQLDTESIEVIWSVYKTTDKIKVSGKFNEFNSDRLNKEFTSIEDLLLGLSFSINSLSSTSGDPIRDLNLKEYFFKYLTEKFEINGVFRSLSEDTINIVFNFLGEEEIVPFKYKLYKTPSKIDKGMFDYIINIIGVINLENQDAKINAYNSIHQKCYDLHKGLDGISRTWKEVDISIKALILSK